MMMISRICVYCSSSAHVDPLYFKAAEELGGLIAQGGYQLVYGGGNLGLMGALSGSAKKGGAYIISVNLKLFVKEGINFEAADELIVSPTMNERKRIMAEQSDAFIALPGGYGTLEELAEVLTLKQLHFHTKPIVIINTKHYYDHLLDWLEHSYGEKFVKETYRCIYHVAHDPEHAMKYIEDYKPVDLPLKW
jgi:uncharacterized protein (TIGR00730 family)